MHSGMGVLNYFFMGLWVLNCLFCVSYHFDHSNFELKVQGGWNFEPLSSLKRNIMIPFVLG